MKNQPSPSVVGAPPAVLEEATDTDRPHLQQLLIDQLYRTLWIPEGRFCAAPIKNGLTTPGLIHGRAWVACDATTMLGERLGKIGAMVVARGCDVTFQLAGVAVSSALFADILCLFGGRHRCRHDDPSGNILITRQHSWVLRRPRPARR